MGADCCDHCDMADPHRGNAAYRRVLWDVLAINAVMFAVEIGAGLAAGGPTSLSPRSWRPLRSRARGSWCGSLSANYAGRFRLRRDADIENTI
jgi:hypothetical protein